MPSMLGQYDVASENILTLEDALRLYLSWEKDGAVHPGDISGREVFSLFTFPDRLPAPLRNYINAVSESEMRESDHGSDGALPRLIMPGLLQSKYHVKWARLKKLRARERKRVIEDFLRELAAFFLHHESILAQIDSALAYIESVEALMEDKLAPLPSTDDAALADLRDELQRSKDVLRERRDALDDRRLPRAGSLDKVEKVVQKQAVKARAIKTGLENKGGSKLVQWWKDRKGAIIEDPKDPRPPHPLMAETVDEGLSILGRMGQMISGWTAPANTGSQPAVTPPAARPSPVATAPEEYAELEPESETDPIYDAPEEAPEDVPV